MAELYILEKKQVVGMEAWHTAAQNPALQEQWQRANIVLANNMHLHNLLYAFNAVVTRPNIAFGGIGIEIAESDKVEFSHALEQILPGCYARSPGQTL